MRAANRLVRNKIRKKRTLIKVNLIAFLTFIVTIGIYLSVTTGKYVVESTMLLNNEKTKENSKKFLKDVMYDIKSIDKYYSEDIFIASPNGYKLSAKYISKDKEKLNKADTVILVHPHG